MSNHNNHNGQRDQQKQKGPKMTPQEQQIFNRAKNFAETSSKKYCKKLQKDFGYSKKEAKLVYFEDAIDTIPDVCFFALRWGHQPQYRQLLEGIYEKFSDPKFIKVLTKKVSSALKTKDDDERAAILKDFSFLPAVLNNLIREIESQNKKLEEEGEALLDTKDIVELCNLINSYTVKKVVKKLECDGERLMYSILAVYPTPKVANFSPAFYMSRMMSVIYRAAAEVNISLNDIDRIFKKVVTKDYYQNLILFLLLEKKTVTQNFSNNQYAVYNRISEWLMKTLNKMDRKTISKILQTYVNRRYEDIKRNKDTNRRLYLRSTVAHDVYPTLHEVIGEVVRIYEKKAENNPDYQGPDLKKIL